MWTTRDGYELVLPRAGVDAVAARLDDGAGADAARRRGVSAVAQLVADAQRTPAVVPSAAGAPRQLFASRRAGRQYGILTRPVGDRRHVITAVRPTPPAAQEELRLPTDTKQITAAVTWKGPVTLDKVVAAFNFRGVYVLEAQRGASWVPVYVGKADGESVGRRWHGRLRTFREFGMPYPAGFRVYGGAVHRRVLITKPRTLTNIDVVETILIRQLLGGADARRLFGGAERRLTNSIGAGASSGVVVPAGLRVEITHGGSPPEAIAKEPRILRTVVNATTSDVRFELPLGEDA